MKNRPIISVIIPVFNMELYIERCLNSIVHQTYDSLDIIVINDGSTDNSLGIINEFAKNDHRIQVLSKTNEGIGGACTDGLLAAKGDYISFVDGDDYIELNTYEVLAKHISKHDVDLIQFGDRHFNSQNETINRWFDLKQELVKGNAEIIKYQFEVIKVPSLACKIFRKSLFEDVTSINQNIGIDHLITYQILLKAESLLVIPDALYNVYVRPDSVSRSAYNDSSINQSLILFKKLIEIFQTKSNNNLLQYIIVHYLNLIIVLGLSIYTKSNKRKLSDFIEKECEFDKFSNMIPSSSEVINLKFRLKIKLFSLNPYYYYRIYEFFKTK